MNTHRISKTAGLAALVATLLMAACGQQTSTTPSLSGTYRSPDEQGSITFHPDGTVLLHVSGQNIATTYTLAGDQVEIKPPAGLGPGAGPNLHLKIDGNGCLYGDLGGMDPHEKVCMSQ